MSSFTPIQQVQPQRVDFDTCQTTDWLDGLPLIGTPSLGGVLAGPSNVGQGSLVASAAPYTALGVHKVTVAALVNGLIDLAVSDPSGTITGFGIAGLPFYAGGLTINLTQATGQAPLAVGDTFAVSVVPAPVDVSGLIFQLDARVAVGSATVALQANSGGPAPTIKNGGPLGVIAMAVPRASMAGLAVKPEGYPFGITATDPVTGLAVTAFYGLIHHVAVPAQIGQVS